MHVNVSKSLWATVSIVLFLLISCNQNNVINPKLLFHLPLGTLPGEYKYWNNTMGKKFEDKLVIKEGIFYIANGDRVLKLSSNGYLLDYIGHYYLLDHDNETNHINVFGDTIPYSPFNISDINNLVVDSNQRILIAHRNAENFNTDYLSFDNELYDNIQLIVYGSKQFQYQIVREGDTRHFTSVWGLHMRSNDDVVIVSKEKNTFVTYIFDKEGRFLQKVIIPTGTYPNYFNLDDKQVSSNVNDGDMFGTIKAIVPSKNKNYLYVQFDYHQVQYDEFRDSIIDLSFYDSKILRIDLSTGSYDKAIDIPVVEKYSLQLLKVLKNEMLVFMSYNNQETEENTRDEVRKTPRLLLLNTSGKIHKYYQLMVPDVNYLFINYAVDDQGNVGALVTLKDRVEVYWWER